MSLRVMKILFMIALQIGLVSCDGIVVKEACGNGQIDQGEDCDGNLGGDGDLDLAGTRSHWEPPQDGFFLYRNNGDNLAWLIVAVNAGPQNPYGVTERIYINKTG